MFSTNKTDLLDSLQLTFGVCLKVAEQKHAAIAQKHQPS
jgi:hypothetical protein